jgi:hypothetical protein
MEVTINDIDELPVFSKRKVFMEIFFEVHSEQPEENLLTIISSYHKAELRFIKKYQAKAYKTSESFLRTYYYFMNSKNISY